MTREDYSKYYIQGSDHYLIPKYVFKELFNEMINWKEESQRQKEVIDRLNFIKNRKNQGASQENINKMAIEFVNSYLKEVSE